VADKVRGPLGAAMWGGRAVDGTYPRVVPEVDDDAGMTVRVSAVDLTSLVLYLLGIALIVAGAGMLWGLGGAMLAAGCCVLPVAILMGLGSDR
jgi:hypothetical protein